MATRAKMRLDEKREFGRGDDARVELIWHAVTGPNDTEWSWFTPSGEFKLTVRKSIADKWAVGDFYFVDISGADDSA